MVLITNHFQRAISLLASQFREEDPEGTLTKFQKLIKVFVESMQDADNVDMTLQEFRWLDTAYGVQLDGLGEILGLARDPDESDTSYRERLRFQIFINNSNATPEEVIRVLAFLTDATKIWYHEYYPAAFQMSTDGLTFPNPPSSLVTAIQSVSPAAVQYTPITATYGTKPFSFSGDPVFGLLAVVPDENTPFDEFNVEVDTLDILEVNTGQTENPETGGGFAEAIWTNYPTTPIVYAFDNTGAGQLAEVIMYNGS